jgi:transposase
MIPQGVEVFVCLEPVNLRCSFDRLATLAQERVGRDARSGALVLFFGRRQDALKVLYFDGSGLCIFYKRLDRGRFRVPTSPDSRTVAIAMSEQELDALLDGVEISPRKPPDKRPPRGPRVH